MVVQTTQAELHLGSASPHSVVYDSSRVASSLQASSFLISKMSIKIIGDFLVIQWQGAWVLIRGQELDPWLN